MSQPKALRSRVRSYFSELCQASCSFRSSFTFSGFLATAVNLCYSTATGPKRVANSMQKHLPRCSMDFLFHNFHVFWSVHSFSSIWNSSTIPIYKIRKPLDWPASFQPTSLTTCVSSCLSAIFYSIYSSVWSLNFIFPFSFSISRFPSGTTYSIAQILYLFQSISN